MSQRGRSFSNTEFITTSNRPATTSGGKVSYGSLVKLKQLKEHTKLLDGDYQKVLVGVTKTQNSISKLNRDTQKIRVDFLKLYENKKMKLSNRQQVQNKKMETKNHRSMVSRQTKQRKLIDQLQLEATRNEEQQKNATRQQMNKIEKQKVKKQIRSRSFDRYLEAQSQYNRIKEERLNVQYRNKKIEDILFMRGKLNYAEKVEKEIDMIKQYEQVLEQFKDADKQVMRPYTSVSKNFFITSKLADTNPTCGRDTSHTARTKI